MTRPGEFSHFLRRERDVTPAPTNDRSSDDEAPQWVRDAAWQTYCDQREIADVNTRKLLGQIKRAAFDSATDQTWTIARSTR